MDPTVINEASVNSVNTVYETKGLPAADQAVLETTKEPSDLSNHVNEKDCESASNRKAYVFPENEDDWEDGGYGWFVVLGAFMAQVTSFGTAASWGIMQDYYDQHVFTDIPDAQFQLSWAGTLMEVFVNLMSPLAQVLASIFGFRVVLIAGTILASLGLELAGFSTKIWHLYLTQGVLFGAGASFLWVIAMGITPQWFNRRRGLALGLAASGGGIGGLVFPFFLTPLNNTLGVGWTYRILGFVCLVCDVITCIVIKEKFPAKKRMKKLSAILSLDVLKNSTFVIWIIGSVISLAGYFVPYFFVPSYASYIGLTPSQSSVLIAVMSAANFTGRVVVGQIGDMIGRLNADIIFTFICGLSNLLIWNFAYSYGVLMAFSVIFGLTCGSYFALMSPITATILGMEKYPTGLSVLMLFSILAVFGPSISSAIETHVNAEPYFTYKMFAGLAYVIGGVILVILKMKMCKNKIFAKI